MKISKLVKLPVRVRPGIFAGYDLQDSDGDSFAGGMDLKIARAIAQMINREGKERKC